MKNYADAVNDSLRCVSDGDLETRPVHPTEKTTSKKGFVIPKADLAAVKSVFASAFVCVSLIGKNRAPQF
jgi:hypothetical protein